MDDKNKTTAAQQAREQTALRAAENRVEHVLGRAGMALGRGGLETVRSSEDGVELVAMAGSSHGTLRYCERSEATPERIARALVRALDIEAGAVRRADAAVAAATAHADAIVAACETICEGGA